MRQFALFSSVLFLFLTACTPKHVVFDAIQPNSDKDSIVYVYRPSVMANAMVSPALLLNGKMISELESGSYHYNRINPGQHIISLDLGERYQGNKTIVLDVKPDEVYFIRATSDLHFQMNKPYTRSFNLELVESSIAKQELTNISVERRSQLSFKASEVQEESPAKEGEEFRFSIENTRNPFSR